ncbi:MAG: V-type ATPase subunit [Candidatus Anstonellales archaeon]
MIEVLKTPEYAYAYTRTRAMKSMMLTSRDYEDLLSVKTVEGMLELLRKGPYRPYFSQELLFLPAPVAIEGALTKAFSSSLAKMERIVPADGKETVRALVRKWKVINLEILLSHRIAGDPWEVVEGSMIEGPKQLEDYRAFYNSTEPLKDARRIPLIKEIFNKSSEIFVASVFKKTFIELFKKHDVLQQIRVLLDAYYYYLLDKEITSSDPSAAKLIALIKEEIDIKNVITILRLKHKKRPESEINNYIVEGGNMGKHVKRLFSYDTTKLSAYVESRWGVKGSLDEIEIEIEKKMALKRLKSFYREGVSLGSIIGFMFLKEEEMKNVRKIVRGKELGMGREEIEKSLVMI